MNKRIQKKKIRERLLFELALMFPDEADAISWLETPHDALDGSTPREAITSGQPERVIVLLDSLDPERLSRVETAS